ncbi:MAG: hypothetical protein ACFN0Y_04105 [Lactobacillus sp.]|jgi:hypothetical protein
MILLSLFLFIFLLWLGIKLSWGLVKILAFVTVIGILAVVASYVVLPVLAIAAVAGGGYLLFHRA